MMNGKIFATKTWRFGYRSSHKGSARGVGSSDGSRDGSKAESRDGSDVRSKAEFRAGSRDVSSARSRKVQEMSGELVGKEFEKSSRRSAQHFKLARLISPHVVRVFLF